MSQEIKESVQNPSFFQSFFVENEEEDEIHLPDLRPLFSGFLSNLLFTIGHFFPTNPLTCKIKLWQRVQEDLPKQLVEKMRHIKLMLGYNKPIIYMYADNYETLGGNLSFGPAVIAAPFKKVTDLDHFTFEFSKHVSLIQHNDSRNYALSHITACVALCIFAFASTPRFIPLLPFAVMGYHAYTQYKDITYKTDLDTAKVMGIEKSIEVLKTKQQKLFEPSIEKRIEAIQRNNPS
ncbi:MAG: hypothetical protein K940chlam8_00531 [Chlamydiae bacterium]|nr:hypothetical protein [Chlamydiota bacterium]